MLKKGIYENIINQEVERSIQEAESQQLVCLRKQIDAPESLKISADYLAKAIRQRLEDSDFPINIIWKLEKPVMPQYGEIV